MLTKIINTNAYSILADNPKYSRKIGETFVILKKY
jgi:hypothetical protein